MKLSLVLAALALAGCAAKPPPPRLQREHVSKHFVVVVEEQDPNAPEEERAESLVTRPVASGPIGFASEHETAFAMRDPRFAVSVAWQGDCLHVSVARHGLPPFDDFAAQGCVKPDAPTIPVASVTGASGSPIEIRLWVLDSG